MISHSLDNYFSAYLFTNALLTPLFCFYLFATIYQLKLKLRLTLHKIAVVCLCVVPVLIAVTNSLQFSAADDQPQEFTVVAPADQSSAPTLAAEISSQKLDITLPVNQDLYWYGIVTLSGEVIKMLLLAGPLMFFARLALQHMQLRQIQRRAQSHDKSNGVTVFISPLIRAPFSTGMLNKRIYLPDSLEEQNKAVILAHEFNHFRCRHQSWQLLDALLCHCFWFNPISHLLRRQGELLREMECDEVTVAAVGKFEYSRALLQMAESLSTTHHPSFLSHSWIVGKTLKQRIENILGVKSRLTFRIVKISFTVVIVGSIGYFGFSNYLNNRLLEDLVIAEIQRNYENRVQSHPPVQFEKLPRELVHAVLVQEDKRFFEHNGIDVIAVLRTLPRVANNMLFNTNRRPMGGSTISVQLIKSIVESEATSRKTMLGKLTQFRAAKILERHYSKEEILEMYLSYHFFGKGAWGLAEASQLYLNKDYSELNLEESALLIPVINLPSIYNPIVNPEVATKRQQYLLNRIQHN